MSQEKKLEHIKPEPRPVRGLGDTLHNVIHDLNLHKLVEKDNKPCGPCEKNRKKLNKWVPYKTN